MSFSVWNFMIFSYSFFKCFIFEDRRRGEHSDFHRHSSGMPTTLKCANNYKKYIKISDHNFVFRYARRNIRRKSKKNICTGACFKEDCCVTPMIFPLPFAALTDSMFALECWIFVFLSNVISRRLLIPLLPDEERCLLSSLYFTFCEAFLIESHSSSNWPVR